MLSRGRWRPVAQMLQAIKADARAAGERLEAGAMRLENVQVVGRDAASIELYKSAWRLDAPLVMKVLTEADGIVCPRTIAGKYLSIVEPDHRSLDAVDRVIAALEPVRDLRLLTDNGPWGRGSDHSHGALPIYRIWRDGPLRLIPGAGQFRIPGHAIEEVFVALSCWADGARAGRVAAAELKVDVVAKELQGMDMIVPRDAASFPSVPSMRRPRRYYKAAHWTRGWADREKAARFVAEVTAFGRKEEAYTRDFHAAARRVWGPRGF